jgi:hypothetical protein
MLCAADTWDVNLDYIRASLRRSGNPMAPFEALTVRTADAPWPEVRPGNALETTR